MQGIERKTRDEITMILRESWTLRDPIHADVWADRYRVIPARGNPEPGRWTNARTPYLTEVMRSCSDPTIRQVSAMKGSQLGFTDALIFNVAGWAVDQDPGPHLIIMPNDRLAKRTVKIRFVPSIRATPALLNRYRVSKAESTMEVQVFDTMDIVVCGSNSSTNVRSTPFRRVAIDEFDLCEPSTKEEGTQRMAAFDSSPTLLICNGTPSFAGVGIHREVMAGDRRRYLCPCPHCGMFQEWLWENLVWSGGISADPELVERVAFVRCVGCKGRIENHHKPWCLRWGCWQPDGVGVEGPPNFRAWTETAEAIGAHTPGILHPEYRTTGEPDNPSVAHRSYRISSLYSPFKTFGWVAIEFIKSGGMPDRDWVNGKLGRPWHAKGEDANLSIVRKVCKPTEQGGFAIGEVPADVVILGAGLDIGNDHAWFLIGGYSEKMHRMYWVDAKRVEAPRGSLRALAGLLTGLSYPHGAGGVMRPVLFFPDTGHRQQEVYDLCVELGRERAYPIKGGPATSEAVVSRTFEQGADGKPLPKSLTRLVVNTNHWSDVVFARLFAAAGVDREGDAVPSMEGVEPQILCLPHDFPEDYAKQFTSEQCVRGIWEKKPGREDNHLLDCARYLEAGITRSGGRLLTSEEMMKMRGVPRVGWTPQTGQQIQAPIIKAEQQTAARAYRPPAHPLVERFRRRP